MGQLPRVKLSEIPLRTAMSLVATLGARGLGALGALALSYWLANVAGAAGLGQFTYVQSIVGILTLVSRMGAEHTLLRLIATLNERREGGAAWRYFLAGLCVTLTLALVIAILAVPAAGLGLLSPSEAMLLDILIWSLPSLMVLSATSGYLRGHRMVGLGMLLDIGMVSGVTALFAWALGETALPDIAALFVAVALALALLSLAGATVLAYARYGHSWRATASPGRAPAMRDYLLSGWPFAIIAVSIFATQAGSFALAGATLDDATIGLLRATERFAVLIGFALTAINPFVAPRVAAANAREGIAGIRHVYAKALMISISAALPVAMLVVVAGRWLLSTLGTEFAAAYPFLLILGLGQLIQACFGSSTTVLEMAGREKVVMRISISTLIAAILLYPLTTYWAGGYGFAFTYLLLIVAKEALTFWQIRALARSA